MSRLNIAAIREAIADTCAAVVKNSTAYRPDGINSFPALWVDMPPVEKMTFQTNAVWNIPLRVVVAVSNVWDRSSQELVDELVVDIWEVLDADRTLAGVVSSAVVTEFTPVPSTENRDWVGGIFDIKVSQTATLASS